MLERLLELLRAGGTRRVSDLARELETTPALVQLMLDELVRLGYLRRVAGSCDAHCGSCSLDGLCATGAGGQIWTLVEKGGGSST